MKALLFVIIWQSLQQTHSAAKRSRSQVPAWVGTLWLISEKWRFANIGCHIADRLPQCSYPQSPQDSAESHLLLVLLRLHKTVLTAYWAK